MATDGKAIGLAGRVLQAGLAFVAIVSRWYPVDARHGTYLAVVMIGTAIGGIVGIQLRRPVIGIVVGISASVCAYVLFVAIVILALAAL